MFCSVRLAAYLTSLICTHATTSILPSPPWLKPAFLAHSRVFPRSAFANGGRASGGQPIQQGDTVYLELSVGLNASTFSVYLKRSAAKKSAAAAKPTYGIDSNGKVVKKTVAEKTAAVLDASSAKVTDLDCLSASTPAAVSCSQLLQIDALCVYNERVSVRKASRVSEREESSAVADGADDRCYSALTSFLTEYGASVARSIQTVHPTRSLLFFQISACQGRGLTNLAQRPLQYWPHRRQRLSRAHCWLAECQCHQHTACPLCSRRGALHSHQQRITSGGRF